MSGLLPPVILEMRANASQVYTEMAKVKAATAETAGAADASAIRIQAATGKGSKGFENLGKWSALGAVGVVAASTMMAASFQSKMSLLATAADEPAAKVKAISAGVLNLAQSTGTSVDQMAAGAYTISKAMGSQGAAAQLLVLKAAAEGAKAENVDLATATNALTSVMMSYHVKAKDAVSVENEIIAASGKSKTTMQEFAGSLSTVIPVASAAHISFAQVGGAIATLTQHGTSAQESTQELANTIRALQAPNNVAVSAMQQLGLNVTDVETKLGKRGLTGTISLITDAIQKKLGPSGTVIVDTMKKSATGTADLQKMIAKMPPDLAASAKAFLNSGMSMKQFQTSFKGMGAAGDAQGKQFLALANTVKGYNDQIKAGGPAALTAAAQLKAIMGGATGMNTALMLGGENMKTFTADTKLVGDAAKKTGSNVSSWAKTQQNAKVQMDMLGSTVQVIAVRLGNMLLPAVTGVSKAVSGWLQGLTQGNPIIVTLTAVVGGLAAAVLLGSVAFKAYTVWQGIAAVLSGEVAAKTLLQAAAFSVMRTAQIIATAAQWAWNAAMDANPIMLIILAVAALIAVVVLLVTHWKQVTEFLTSAWRNVASFFVTVGNGIAKWWNGLWAGIVGWAKNLFGPYVEWTVAIFRAAYSGLLAVGSAISSWWTGLWGGITNWAKDTFSGYINWTVSTFRGVVGFFTSIGRDIGNAWSAIWSGLGDILRGAFSGAVDFVRGIIDGIIGAINGVINGINGMTSLASKVGINIPKIGHLPSLDVGGTIPGGTNQPVLMIGHGGEEVLSNDMLAGRVPISARVVQAVMASVTGFGAAASAAATPAVAGAGGGSSNTVVVNAVTNASPSQIASTVGWEIRRRG